MEQLSPADANRRPVRRLRSRSAAAPTAATGAAAELRAVIEAIPEAVLVLDARDCVRIANPIADKLFAGRPVASHTDLLSRFEPLPAGQIPNKPVTLRARDMPNRWFELQSFPIDRTGPSGTETTESTESTEPDAGGRILVLSDVTAARQERKQRRAFLSILSHELRTPITTIYAGSRVLARREAPTRRSSQEIAADISAEAARLYDVVEDLLVLTRVEQGILELSDEPVLLQRVVEAAVRVGAARYPDVRIVVDGVSDPPTVRGDAVYIEQVVRNLVTAAAAYGAAGPIEMRLDSDDARASLTVLDRRPDASGTELAALFDLDEETPRLHRGARSPGIGLFVCRRLVEAMHGEVWGKPRDGGGAAVGFALPRYLEAD